jgi:hypothetical protein
VEHLAGLSGASLDDVDRIDAALTGEAIGVTRRFLEHHLERRLSSLAVLDG